MTEKKIRKEYTNGEITVVWQPHLCNHSSICLMKLPEVFRLSKRPWVNISGASTAEIIDVVNQCPTKALEYFRNNEENTPKPEVELPKDEALKIEILPNGPLIIKGKLSIKIKDQVINCNEMSNALCRCGLSKKQPFCDGAHFGHKFE